MRGPRRVPLQYALYFPGGGGECRLGGGAEEGMLDAAVEGLGPSLGLFGQLAYYRRPITDIVRGWRGRWPLRVNPAHGSEHV